MKNLFVHKTLSMITCLAMCGSFFLTACDDDDESYADLEVEVDSKVYLVPNQTKTINIKQGSGEYSASSSDNDVVTSSTSGNEISLVGKAAGEAKVTVTDGKTKQSKIIDVSVVDDFTVETNNVSVNIGMTKQVKILAGSGNYSIKGINSDYVEAVLKDDIIEITGRQKGTTKVEVTDEDLNKTETIEITISDQAYMIVTLIPLEGYENSITIHAAEEDQSDIWMEFTRNGVKHAEPVTRFGEKIVLEGIQDFVIYGNVTEFYTESFIADYLDVTANKELTRLEIAGSTIEKLDLTNNEKLTRLLLNANSEISEIDLSKNKNLTHIQISATSKIKTIDLSSNTELIEIVIVQNEALTSINIDGLSKVKDLRCYNNYELESVDVTGMPELEELSLAGNKLSRTPDLTNNPQLKILVLSNNPYEASFQDDLNLFFQTQLEKLYLNECGISDATDIFQRMGSKYTLKVLHIWGNSLQSLSLSGLPMLINVDCSLNEITEEDEVIKLMESLPIREYEEEAKITLYDTSSPRAEEKNFYPGHLSIGGPMGGINERAEWFKPATMIGWSVYNGAVVEAKAIEPDPNGGGGDIPGGGVPPGGDVPPPFGL